MERFTNLSSERNKPRAGRMAGEEDNLRRRESRRSIPTAKDDMGSPAPSAQPTEAKQMLDPTLNLGSSTGTSGVVCKEEEGPA